MEKKRTNIIITAVVLLVACLPLLTPNCISGHDMAYHLLRIEALKEGILHFRPFLRINMLFFGGQGYASSLFYPDMLLYFPALLRALGVGINLSYHLFLALCIILVFVSAYFSAKYVTGSRYAALITAVIITLYQYHLDDIYVRAAVGEICAAIFVPMVIAGLWDLLYKDMKHPWILFAGMSGVILSHTITTILCLLICVIFVICGIKRFISSPRLLLRPMLTALSVLAFTAFYWMGALEMLLSGAFASDSMFDLAYESVEPWYIATGKGMMMGAAVFILLIPRIFTGRKRPFGDLLMWTGLVLSVAATSLMPWARLQGVLGFLQFPWRIFMVTGPLLAFAAGMFVEDLGDTVKGEGTIKPVLMTAVCGIMIWSALSCYGNGELNYYSYSDDYFSYAPFTAEVIGGEWLPKEVTDREEACESAGVAYTDTGRTLQVTRSANELAVSGIGPDEAYVDVPFIFYKGYEASSGTGGSLEVSSGGKNGRVRVYTRGEDEVRVFYGGTLIQHISDVISLIFLLVCVAGAVIRSGIIRRIFGKKPVSG